MQNINAILKVGGTGTAWVTAFGAQVPLPVVTVGIKAALRIDLRGDDPAGSSDLPAYPIEQFAGAASWYFAIDNDYDRDTAPKLLQITGISVASVDGATILTAVVPNTAVPGLLEAVGKLKNVTLKSEIGWLDAEGDTIGCIGFDLTITNRVYLPGDIPEEVQSDPEYLTSAQVLAHINAAVADAVAALDVTGEPGPPPTIAVGTVQSGDTAAATLTPVPDTPGAYTLNLTLPRGEEGDAADAPVLTLGTVQSGDTAAATLTPVPDTPGAYTLSLTLPRGIDGSGITPLTGDWNAETIYSLRDAIRHNGAWWYSKSEGNVGHAPPANRQSDAYWQLIVADGEDAEPVLMAFTPDPDEQSAWHLPPYTAGDTHYRFSLDGGATWGVTMPLSMPAASTVILFNPDAESDWADPVAVVGQSYSTVFGKYMRARRAGSSYGEAMAVHDLDPQTLRIQFAAPPADGQEPSWHAELQAGDDRVRIFNAAGSIGPSVFTFTLDGLELDSVQFCAYEDPWHTSYVLGDRYRKFSTDGGLTFGQPVPLYGASAYDEWLAAGNIGTREDFLDSLKGEPGVPGAPGSGIHIDASGTLAERDNYDSTPLGFVFLAADGDGSGGPALFQRTSATQGVWSSPVPVTPGPKGIDGKDGKDGIDGAPGAAAPIVPDFEFTSAELLEDIDHGNHLLLDGTTPIAQVELYDAAGNGIVIERGDAAENGRCMIVTRWSAGETIIYFGELDVSRGGRVRFAQSSAVYTGRTVTTDIIPIASAAADTDDDDGDADTTYKVIIPGYVVGVSTYADAGAILADRYDTKITYDPSTAESTIWLSQGEYDTIAALPSGKDVLVVDYARDLTAPRYMITQVVNAASPSTDKYPSEAATVAYADGLAIKAVTELPATPIAGQMIRLTAADDAAKAAPGVYVHDGVGWTCISYEAAYALGNLGATPTLALIPGAAYTATIDAEITTFTVAFTRTGLCSITLTNATEYAVAQPSMAGRTSKLLAEGAWDGAATALSKALIEDDGTFIIVSAGGLA